MRRDGAQRTEDGAALDGDRTLQRRRRRIRLSAISRQRTARAGGLAYVSSWVDTNLERCYQLMETDNPLLLDQWIARWSDIVDFEVHPVITSAEAAERIAPHL